MQIRSVALAAVCTVILAANAGCQIESEDGVGSSSRPITFGIVSAPGAHPETVMLFVGGGTCTGTLITSRVILTAQHCIQGLSQATVFFGNNPEQDGFVVESVDLEPHPSVDIGLVKMVTASDLTPIPIYRKAPVIGTPVTIVGFGEDEFGVSGFKREGTTTVTNLQGDLLFIGLRPQGTCFGDSGGPTFIDEGGTRFVAGVTSFGGQDCTQGVSADVRTDTTQNWIDNYLTTQGGCQADGECVLGCPIVDSDCCGRVDGQCIAGCPELDPDCSALGDSCESDGECESYCATVGETSRCSQDCSEDNPCPDGYSCRDGVACWPKGGGCSTSGKSTPIAILAVFAAMMILGSRRRRVAN